MNEMMETKELKLKAIQELKQMLDEEMAKPYEKRDYDKIDEISRAYTVVMEDEEQEKEAIKNGYEAMITSLNKPKIHMTLSRKSFIAVASVAALVIGANIYSVAAYDMNVFSALVKISNGGFSLNQSQDIIGEYPVSSDDPYGIKAACAEEGLTDIFAPTYIPENFVLESVEPMHMEDYADMVDLYFYDSKRNVITISYIQWYDDESCSFIPSDHLNLTETTVCGSPAIISKEDGQYVLVFRNQANLETEFWMDGVDYEECDKIVRSLI